MKKIKNIVVIVLAFLASGGSQLSCQMKVAEQDSLALVAFYWATDGPNWISNQEGFGFDNLTSEWQETYDGAFNKWFDGPVEDWFGIKVENRAIEGSEDSIGRVTWLWPVIGRRTDGQNNLNGYVPREIGLMTALEQFRVNGNDGFTFELIPDEIYHESLEHFDTEAAWFGGGLSDALRNSINIRKLNVRYNNYDYMPNLDFLDEEGVRNLDGTQWFYNSRFSYFYMERIVDFFFTISPTPMEFGFEARDMFDVGDDIEIVAPIGSSVEMVCIDAGEREEFITYQWFKDNLSKFGKKDKTFSIASVKESDYGQYKTRITNEYVKSYDTNGNYGEVFTKGVTLVPEATSPLLYKAVVDNSGSYIDLYFNKNMTGASGFDELEILAEDEAIAVQSAEVRGRISREVRLLLESDIDLGETVIMNYAGSGIKDENGGLLQPLTDLEIENRARKSPVIEEALTTLDGSGIEITYDYYISEESLTEASFQVLGSQEYQVISASLIPGEVNASISKTILLTLETSISDSTEVISVEYLEGDVHGLYGGSAKASGSIPVENIVTLDRTSVLIQFEDGCKELSDVVIKGSWKATPVQLYDDGNNGDKIAGDGIWSSSIALAEDQYTWDALSRETMEVTDTIISTDTLGNMVLTLVPGTVNVDSLLSENYNLEFTIENRETTGDTIYGVFNRDVQFNVQVEADGEEIYLMGIDEDWADGLIMEAQGDNIYSITIPKYTAGDFIAYNYRRGDSWENLTPESREYRVINDTNIINDEFGIFTSLDEEEYGHFHIYPNPYTGGELTLDGFAKYGEIRIYDATGRIISNSEDNQERTISLSLSEESTGFLLVTAFSAETGKRITFKIIKL